MDGQQMIIAHRRSQARQYNVEDEAVYLEDTVRDEGRLYLFAFPPTGELAGTCSVTFATRKARVRHLGNIAVSVAKAYWSTGLGRHMMAGKMPGANV